jgi:predicted permease
MELLALFGNNLLPVFLAAGAGYLLAAKTKMDPRPVSHLAFFVLAPCLVFQVIMESRAPGEAILRMVGFTLACQLGLAAIAALVTRQLGWPRPLRAAVVLTVLLPNAGNYGLSASLFAFGDEGLAQASLFFVTASVVSYTAGVLVASLGRTGPRAALLGLFKVPAVWSVVLALFMGRVGWTLPLPLERTVGLLAEACIPVLLVILGMQLQDRAGRGPAAPLTLAVALRLLGGIGAALLFVPLFGLEGAARQAGILQAAMPSAVLCTILATEYDVEPGFVTAVVFLTTLLSPLTLTPLLAWLGA